MNTPTRMVEVSWQNGHGPKRIELFVKPGILRVDRKYPPFEMFSNLADLLYNLAQDWSFSELRNSALRQQICNRYPDLMHP